jgi:hypothetical protein
MNDFDQQWRKLTASARRAPECPLPAPPTHLAHLLPAGKPAYASWSLCALAAASALVCALTLPWLGDVVAASKDLVPSMPELPDMPALAPPPIPRPPRLPPPPSLPNAYAVIRAITLEEAAP